MTWSDYFKTLLSLVIWREARGEGNEGMRAVGHVIRNRVLATHLDDKWEDVITGKNQFSSITVKGDSQTVLFPVQPDLNFAYAMLIAEKIYNGLDVDPTSGALYYANLKTATSGWFFDHIVNDPQSHPMTVSIGNHTFFR